MCNARHSVQFDTFASRIAGVPHVAMADDAASVCGGASVANDSDAPPPPRPDWAPRDYIVRRCAGCKRYNNMLCPWPINECQSLKQWHPVLSWGRGTRDKPLGVWCRVCTNVTPPQLNSCYQFLHDCANFYCLSVFYLFLFVW